MSEPLSEPYFVYVINRAFSAGQAGEIRRRLRAIHPDLALVGPVHVPGSSTRGWVERPACGMETALVYERDEVRQVREAVQAVLGPCN